MLKLVLKANAVSCALFGALFFFAGPAIAAFIGTPPVLLLQVLGLGLMVNAAALTWASLCTQPNRKLVLLFAIGDGIWVLATIVLVTTGLWISTTNGVLWAAGIAAFVGACGVLQWKLAPISA